MDGKFTVGDPLVQHSLLAVDAYNFQPHQYKAVVSGGVANQLYASADFGEFLRPTHDIDLVVSPKLTSETFRSKLGRGIANGIFDCYKPQISTLRHVYEVKVEDDDEKPFFIHAYKWTENGWERQKRNIERQVSTSEKVAIPGSERTVYTVRPEEIVGGKVDRLGKIACNGKVSGGFDNVYRAIKGRKWEYLAELDIKSWHEQLARMKDNLPAFYDRGRGEFMKALDEYVYSKDLFDVALISKMAANGSIGFDEKYYDAILQE